MWLTLARNVNDILPALLWIASLVLVLVCLVWGVTRVRQGLRWLAALPVVIVAVLCLPPGTQLLRTLLAHPPAYLSGPSQAIVVLGRGSDNGRRAEIAANLWQERPEVPVVLSGTWDSLRMAEWLKSSSRVPSAKIILEPDSRTTRENAVLTRQKLAPLGIERIVLLSDPEHMLRATLAFRGVGFEVQPIIAPEVSLLCGQCYIAPFNSILAHEYIGLVAYGLRGWF